MITRRAFLIGGVGTLGLAGAGCSAAVPTTAPRSSTRTLPPGRSSAASIVTGTFNSRYRRAETGWAIVYPPEHVGEPLPVLVALHCRGANHTSVYAGLHLDHYLAEAVALGVPPFAIASVDGGTSSYWHPRHGTDPAGMVIHEFLPLLARHRLHTTRIGLYGWSMGGYGVLYLAERLGSARVAVTIAESPAIWAHSWQSAAGAFDDATDWRRHDIWTHLARLHGIAMKIDCGGSDGFQPVTRELRARIHPTPAGGTEPGAHDNAFWISQAPAAISFAGHHLAPVRH